MAVFKKKAVIKVARYDKLKQQTITVETLDKMMHFVLNSGTGYIASIIAGLKILCLVGWYWVRSSVVKDQMLIEKQHSEITNVHDNIDQINSDDLD